MGWERDSLHDKRVETADPVLNARRIFSPHHPICSDVGITRSSTRRKRRIRLAGIEHQSDAPGEHVNVADEVK